RSCGVGGVVAHAGLGPCDTAAKAATRTAMQSSAVGATRSSRAHSGDDSATDGRAYLAAWRRDFRSRQQLPVPLLQLARRRWRSPLASVSVGPALPTSAAPSSSALWFAYV